MLLKSLKFTVIVGMFYYSSLALSSSCTINLVKKSATSKTNYTPQGESISSKIVAKLKPQCKFNIRLMSLAEKRQFDINRLKARLKKLRGSI